VEQIKNIGDNRSPGESSSSMQQKNKPLMDDYVKSVSNSTLAWMTILSFVIFGLGLSIAFIFGGL
jgi:hypothetical protein